jgi:hypothetical protein
MTGNGDRKEYRTLDVYLASWLILQGFTPTLQNENSRVVFCFTLSKKLLESLSKFNSGGIVEASKFTFTIKTLKSQMFSRKREF